MRYLIAVDGGGTKTESVLISEQGHIAARDVTKGVNAFDVGMETAQRRLYETITALYEKIPADGELDVVYAGVAACADYFPGVLQRELFPKLPICRNIRMEGDGGNLISAVYGHADGCCLIAGTGSSLYIRSGERLQRYGGWGHLIDTGGSGYTIGRDALLAAFRSFDGRGPKSILYDMVKEQMGMAPENNVPYIYEHGRPYIATFANCVFRAYREGDEAAKRIFDHAVTCLVELVEMGDRVLGKPFHVVAGGGVLTSFPEYYKAVQEASPKNAEFCLLKEPPIYGAALEALWDAGIVPSEKFRNNFKKDYEALTLNTASNGCRADCRYEVLYNK